MDPKKKRLHKLYVELKREVSRLEKKASKIKGKKKTAVKRQRRDDTVESPLFSGMRITVYSRQNGGSRRTF